MNDPQHTFTELRGPRPYVFEIYPEDWIGRTIEVWDDGVVTMDSGLTSSERKVFFTPVRTLVIKHGMRRSEITYWLDNA